jgi:hypothetical protein
MNNLKIKPFKIKDKVVVVLRNFDGEFLYTKTASIQVINKRKDIIIIVYDNNVLMGEALHYFTLDGKLCENDTHQSLFHLSDIDLTTGKLKEYEENYIDFISK